MAVAAFVTGATALQAQKIGFVSTQKVIDTLPQKDTAEKELAEYAQMYQNQLADMEEELTNLQIELEKESKKPGVSSIRLELLQNNIRKRYEQYQQTESAMNTDLNLKRSQLIAPILKEIKEAVAVVGKAKGYTAVLDNSTEMVLFMSNAADDITDAVIKHMLSNLPKPAIKSPGAAPKK